MSVDHSAAVPLPDALRETIHAHAIQLTINREMRVIEAVRTAVAVARLVYGDAGAAGALTKGISDRIRQEISQAQSNKEPNVAKT